MQQFIELDWLKRWALYTPNKIAIRCADSNRAFSYRELYERSNYLAQFLRHHFGVARGDRVAFLSQNEPEIIFTFFALQRLGAILVPVNYRFAAREISHVLCDSGAKLLIYQDQFGPTLRELTHCPQSLISLQNLSEEIFAKNPKELIGMEADFGSPLMILYTSGTTGAPKGAVITNKMLFWNSVNTGLRLNITQDDRTLIFHPMFHTSGWNVLTTPFFHHGASIVMLKKFDPARVLKLCDEEKLTILFGVPTMMDMMARDQGYEAATLQSLRYAIVGGEPMPLPLISQWAKKGIPIRQGYGLTEFGPNVFSLNEEHALSKIGSIGFPNFYIEVKVISDSGAEVLGADAVGELCLRGPTCTPGYWNNEAATADAIRDDWFHTGDLVRRDGDGFFYVVGRKKDMFISGAENVYPAEIEQFLRTHPAMHEVAVIGVPDSQWGEVGKCFYSTVNGLPIEESLIRDFCRSGLAKYKVPKYFVHLSEIPKGESGKIMKKSLS